MANRTVKDAKSIKGTNPQYLVEKIIRSRIYDSKYWKEECFALTAELVVDKAMELRFIGGVFGGNIKPTPFLCLILKMLQIQPEKDIIVEFIRNEEFKYVRALGAFYMRLTGTALDCYNYLEPLLNDYRKLRRQNRQGVFELVYMDEFVDELVREERACDIILPRMQKRNVLEETNQLQPRISVLEEDEDDDEDLEEEEEKASSPKKGDKSGSKSSKLGSSRRRHASSESEESEGERRRRVDREKYDKSRTGDSRQKDRRRDQELSHDYERRDRDRDRQRHRERENNRNDKYERRDYGERNRSSHGDKDRGYHREKDRDSERYTRRRRHDY